MRRIVVDSSAAIAFLRGETGGTILADALTDSETSSQIHAVNACEDFYDTVRISGEAVAREALLNLEEAGVSISMQMDQNLLTSAGLIKVQFRLSLADAFALALKRSTQSEFMTADRHEFEAVVKAGELGVVFIR